MSDDLDPLDQELANLQKLNGVIEQVIAALDTSTINTENVNSTVNNADKLLDVWIRVLARSNQAQKLILDQRWQGATNDLEVLELEQSQASRRAEEQQLAQARRQQEEQDARERREREALERSTSSQAMTRGRGIRGRGTTTGIGRSTVKKEVVSAYAQTPRAKSSSTTSRVPSSTTSTTNVARTIGSSSTMSGIGRGRGVPVVRGTRASRGRQQGLGRSASTESTAFK